MPNCLVQQLMPISGLRIRGRRMAFFNLARIYVKMKSKEKNSVCIRVSGGTACTQGGGKRAVIQRFQGATHRHAMADPGDCDASRLQPIGKPV